MIISFGIPIPILIEIRINTNILTTNTVNTNAMNIIMLLLHPIITSILAAFGISKISMKLMCDRTNAKTHVYTLYVSIIS